MTTPAPAPGPTAAASALAAAGQPPAAARTLTDALTAAVTAMAVHITGTPAGSEREALTALGITAADADLITH